MYIIHENCIDKDYFMDIGIITRALKNEETLYANLTRVPTNRDLPLSTVLKYTD